MSAELILVLLSLVPFAIAFGTTNIGSRIDADPQTPAGLSQTMMERDLAMIPQAQMPLFKLTAPEKGERAESDPVIFVVDSQPVVPADAPEKTAALWSPKAAQDDVAHLDYTDILDAPVDLPAVAEEQIKDEVVAEPAQPQPAQNPKTAVGKMTSAELVGLLSNLTSTSEDEDGASDDALQPVHVADDWVNMLEQQITQDDSVGLFDELEPETPVQGDVQVENLFADPVKPSSAVETDTHSVIEDFNPIEDVLVIEHNSKQAPRIVSQLVDADGLTVHLQDGNSILLVGLTVALTEDQLSFAQASQATQAA